MRAPAGLRAKATSKARAAKAKAEEAAVSAKAAVSAVSAVSAAWMIDRAAGAPVAGRSTTSPSDRALWSWRSPSACSDRWRGASLPLRPRMSSHRTYRSDFGDDSPRVAAPQPAHSRERRHSCPPPPPWSMRVCTPPSRRTHMSLVEFRRVSSKAHPPSRRTHRRSSASSTAPTVAT